MDIQKIYDCQSIALISINSKNDTRNYSNIAY